MDEKKELLIPEDLEGIEISEEEMPGIISQQFDKIVEIDKRIAVAEEKCASAKALAEKQVAAKGIHKSEAITTTQNAVRSLVDAQTALAEAQKMLFENQQQLAAGMRYLLILGASSIAMNRIVIAELESKLKKATAEQLSEAARQELIGVIKLLREQESAFSKQDRMSEEIKAHGAEIVGIKEVDKKQDKKDKEHDDLIAKNATTNKEQDTEIKRQKKVDEQHDALLKQVKKLAWIGIGIATIALVLAIIALAR